jgi:hypothetical protein
MSVYTGMINGFIIIFLIAGTVFTSIFCVGGEIIKYEYVTEGDVTSITINKQLVITTNINFKDGTTVTVWGEHNIPTGYRIIKYVSSWWFVNKLTTWS